MEERASVIERVVVRVVKACPATLDGQQRKQCGQMAAYYLFGGTHPWESSPNKWRSKMEALIVKTINEMIASGGALADLQFDKSRLEAVAQPKLRIPNMFRAGPLGVLGKKPRSAPGGRSHRNRR